MLEKLDLTKSLNKAEYKEKMAELMPRLGKLQRECRRLGVPVMIAFEGYGASGKGVQIGELIKALDPRGFEVYAVKNETDEEKMHPFLWRFWTKMPSKGRIAIYDSSWYRKVLIDLFDKKTKKSELADAYRSICSFEEQLAADGMVIIKIFLAIDEKEQKKRFDKLLSSDETAWRVSREDQKRNKSFEKYQEMNEEMLRRTDTEYAPWNIVEAVDRKFATAKIYAIVAQTLAEKVEEARRAEGRKEPVNAEDTDIDGELRFSMSEQDKKFKNSILAKADLGLAYTKEEYKARLSKLQKKMEKLHGELYRRRIPVILGFEGWDAGGKGGAIKRLTSHMDPRGYQVCPTASPNDIERKHHYLWRFWERFPKDGHMAIFDRTWYGRVLVERIEGFATEQEWRRAYAEINNMEAHLVSSGAVVLKFWMHIDKEEQAERFRQRQETPEKQWKITDEDWRNREKWEEYEKAVDEMIVRTSTKEAPWHIIEANSKLHARIRVMEIVVDALEKALKEIK